MSEFDLGYAMSVSPADAGADNLPPLPKAERELIELHQPTTYTTHVCTSARYTAEQMREYAIAALRAQQPAPQAGDELPPIEYEKDMDRTYIPLPGGWEIQTKGKGSTFRISHARSDMRWLVLDDHLHEPLEALARDMRNELASRGAAQVRNTSDKLLTIIAYAYQIAGAHNAPKHILDVLANPEAATSEQVEAMLPYQPEQALDMGNRPASIGDDEKFKNLADTWACKWVAGMEWLPAWESLIAHIDAWAARRAVPDGYVMLPIKPTDDMIVAFAEAWYSKARCFDDCEMEDCYAAMIAAASVTGDAK